MGEYWSWDSPVSLYWWHSLVVAVNPPPPLRHHHLHNNTINHVAYYNRLQLHCYVVVDDAMLLGHAHAWGTWIQVNKPTSFHWNDCFPIGGNRQQDHLYSTGNPKRVKLAPFPTNSTLFSGIPEIFWKKKSFGFKFLFKFECLFCWLLKQN